MKILITTDCYIYNLGGITASVLALSNGLRSRGHEVRILSTSNGNQSFHNGDDYFIRSFPAFYYPGLRTSFALNDPLLKELGCRAVRTELDFRSKELNSAARARNIQTEIGRYREDVTAFLGVDANCLSGLEPLLDGLKNGKYRVCAWRMGL